MQFTVLLLLISSVDTARADELARLQALLSEHPQDAFIQYKLGLVYRELGDNRRATVNLEAAVKGGFDNLGAKLNLIEAAFASRQAALALETAKQVISAAAKSTGVLMRVGRLLFDHLFYEESLKAFKLAGQAAPAEFEPRFRLALTYYLLRNYAAVVEVMKPGHGMLANPEAISLTASAEAKLGQVETATSELQVSIAANPQSPHAYINLALIELDQGNSAAAETTLGRFRALKIESSAKVFYSANRDSCSEIAKAIGEGGLEPSSRDKGEFYYQLALQLQERFNFLSAVQLLRLAQANEGNSARVLLAAGTSCLNHDPQAVEPVVLLQEAIRRDARLDKAYYLLGRAYMREGKPTEAIAAYRKAADLRPDASYCLSLGKALKNRQDAIAEFKHALVLDPSYAPAHLELGRTYVQLEEFDKARPHLERAVELEPDYYEAYYLLGRLFHRLGDEEQSRRLLKQFTEKKSALMQQSVIDAGYIGDGH